MMDRDSRWVPLVGASQTSALRAEKTLACKAPTSGTIQDSPQLHDRSSAPGPRILETPLARLVKGLERMRPILSTLLTLLASATAMAQEHGGGHAEESLFAGTIAQSVAA